MNAYEESQEDSQEDLFQADPPEPAGPEQEISNAKIFKELQDVKRELQELRELILGQKTNRVFNMETCTFKKKLNTYLRSKFSQNPWLNSQTDIDFKMEVKRHLRQEGFTDDASAYKTVVSWCTSKFTDLRNQLRRKILFEVKGGKDLRKVPIEDFSMLLFKTYASLEECHQASRIHLALIIRSFLHKKKLLVPETDDLECFQDFWCSFKEYYQNTLKETTPESIQTLKEMDAKRVKKYLTRDGSE